MIDPGMTIPVEVLPADGDGLRPRLRAGRDAARSRRPGRAACARRTARRCSSPRPPSRSSAGPAWAAWPTSCARPSRRCWPTPRSGPDADAPGDDPRATAARGRRSCATTTGSCRSTRGRPGCPDPGHRRRRPRGLERLAAWLDAQPPTPATPLDERDPRPGRARSRGDLHRRAQLRRPGRRRPRPERPLIYGKAAGSVAGHGATLAWDRTRHRRRRRRDRARRGHRRAGRPASSRPRPWTTSSATPASTTCRLARRVAGRRPVAARQVDARLLPGRPVDRDGRRVRSGRRRACGCTIDGEPIQDGRTTQMRYGIAEIIAYLSRHLELRPGDLIATGTPAAPRRRRPDRSAISRPATS